MGVQAMRYRTIVADPPWDHSDGTGLNFRTKAKTGLPYQTMTLEEIKALPIKDLCEGDKWHVNGDRGGSHLYLWTTSRFIADAFDVARAWRFVPTAVLVWCKPARGFNMGGTWPSNVEFIVYGRRGSPPATGRAESRWFEVEQISPGPYLELFARRQRLGWDTWGNEALEHVELASGL